MRCVVSRWLLRLLALSLAIVAVGASPAGARVSTAGGIDPTAVGSITVHQFAQPRDDSGLPHDGTLVEDSALRGLTPLVGVEYTVQRVDADLTSRSGWSDASGLTVSQAQQRVTGTPRTRTTDADGSARFGGLGVGLYLVTETGTGGHHITFRGEPFLVSIPLANDGAWLYDVHVYPKETVTPISKTVDDGSAHTLGDVVSWTIRSQVPIVPHDRDLSSFGFVDQLDERLQFVDVAVRVGATTRTLGSDYTVARSGRRVTISFTSTGLTWLRSRQGEDVVVSLRTRVVGLGDGTITNRASVFVGRSRTSFVSGEALTAWGALRIVKVDRDDHATRLAGAEFALYRARDGRAVGAAVSGSPFVTGARGSVVVPGLKVGTYVLVETRAPRGYDLEPRPIPVTVSAGSLGDATTVVVGDPRSGAQSLPSTGTVVTLGSVVLGVALVGLGLLLVRRGRRRPSVR